MRAGRLHLFFWLFFVAAFLLAGTYVFMNPGGTFISLVHTILPAVLLLVSFWLLFRGYSSVTLKQRLVRLAYAGFSAVLLVLIIMGTYALFKAPFVRGHLLGW